MPLAYHTVKRLWNSGRLTGFTSFEDALQEGYWTLVRAIERHQDDCESTAWSTYLVKCIRRHLSKKSREGGLIRAPYWTLSTKAKKKNPKAYEAALRGMKVRLSDAGGNLSYRENPLSRLETEDLMKAVAKLSPEEQELVKVSFGLGREKVPLRQQAIQMNLSHQGLRLRLIEALRKLRERLDGVPC